MLNLDRERGRYKPDVSTDWRICRLPSSLSSEYRMAVEGWGFGGLGSGEQEHLWMQSRV